MSVAHACTPLLPPLMKAVRKSFTVVGRSVQWVHFLRQVAAVGRPIEESLRVPVNADAQAQTQVLNAYFNRLGRYWISGFYEACAGSQTK